MIKTKINIMIKPFKLNINVKPKLKLEAKFGSLTYKLNINVKPKSSIYKLFRLNIEIKLKLNLKTKLKLNLKVKLKLNVKVKFKINLKVKPISCIS
jgi:hypothetical protein